MTETTIAHTRDSSELQDTKNYVTLKGIVTSPQCFLCNKELSGPITVIDLASHIRIAFHPGCDEVTFNVFDALFGKSLRYYLENGLTELFKEEGMIKSVEL